MSSNILSVKSPELFFGLVAPIGVDLRPTIDVLQSSLISFGYTVHVLKVTDAFAALSEIEQLKDQLKTAPLEERYLSYIKFGDQVRELFANASVLAQCVIARIAGIRARIGAASLPVKTAYIMHQFKRKEEIDLLRSTYDKLFYQISVYSQRSSRVDSLARKISSSHFQADPNRYRDQAEKLVRIDENEVDAEYGQRISDVFHEADFIVNMDVVNPTHEGQIERFIKLVFGSNCLSPTKTEFGMYTAKSASLRSLDLSRQVGAAIFSRNGEIIALGVNEVPRAGGGTYWAEDQHDDRDFRRGIDFNQKRKNEILSELFSAEDSSINLDDLFSKASIKNSQFMDALEYGRIIHAEMCAICEAAKQGRQLQGSVLFCTTFPCHMCAKHIVAAGITEVVFLEPYPKSLTNELHVDSVEVEGQSRGTYSTFFAVKFGHFYGVCPTRYKDLFERKKRKDSAGHFVEYQENPAVPNLFIPYPYYVHIELYVMESVLQPALSDFGSSIEKLKTADGELPAAAAKKIRRPASHRKPPRRSRRRQ